MVAPVNLTDPERLFDDGLEDYDPRG